MSWKDVCSSSENAEKYRKYVEEWESKIHSMLEYKIEASETDADGDLSGFPFAVKDNIAVKDFNLTCGSKMLENLVSPYDSTAVVKLREKGCIAVGKTNMDEFGMGSSTDNSALAVTNNPWDLERVCGGSSGGSAAAAAAGLVPFSLGSDTGGSVRQPASFCGIYGLKPTYGSVSRFGLVSYASSLDVIGILSREIDIIESVFRAVRGIDPNDQTSIEYNDSDELKLPEKPVFSVLKNIKGLSDEISEAYKNAVKLLKEKGYEVREIELPVLEYVVPAYYTIATAEASANLARFNGIRYGYRSSKGETPSELMRYTRDEGFGDEVKLRILLGTYVLRSGFQDRYYVKAQKIRTKIVNELDAVFKSSDLIMLPSFPISAFKHGDENMSQYQQKVADKFTATANLAGIPALSFPAGVYNSLPAGLQFFAPRYGEKMLLDAARIFEKDFPVSDPPGFKTIEEILG